MFQRFNLCFSVFIVSLRSLNLSVFTILIPYLLIVYSFLLQTLQFSNFSGLSNNDPYNVQDTTVSLDAEL